MVMHSISDHALNLPSRNEVEKYLKNLENSKVKEEGVKCTEPVTVQINKSRVTGLLFGNNPLLFLSLSPHGMEDIPSYMKTEIVQYANNRNYGRTMIVDCHNAMGEEISKEDGEDMLKAAKSCLDTLISKESFPIELGYANTDEMDVWTEDLGMGGLGIICLKLNNKKYFLGMGRCQQYGKRSKRENNRYFCKKRLPVIRNLYLRHTLCTSQSKEQKRILSTRINHQCR